MISTRLRGFVSKNNCQSVPMWADFDGRGSVTEFCGGIPPPPQIFGIKGLARNSPQNPSFKELRGQNLDNKELRHRTMWVHATVTASTMIAERSCGRQGWMSHGL